MAEFREICERHQTQPQYICQGVSVKSNGDGVNNATKHFTLLSQLMRQSHQSLKELYECSHTDLDRLISLSDEAGVGARLTGAG